MTRALKWISLLALFPAAVTAVVASLGRALCLPPYWPREYALRCHAGALGRALLTAAGDAAVTAVVLAVCALPAAVLVVVATRLLRKLLQRKPPRAIVAATAAAAWIWMIRQAEPSTLDAIVGWYATAAGAVAAGALAWRAAGRIGDVPESLGRPRAAGGSERRGGERGRAR